jgi:hypothetical protein
MCINQQQNVTSVMNMRQLLNLPLLKTTVGTWATSTKVTEWIIAIQLHREHGSAVAAK